MGKRVNTKRRNTKHRNTNRKLKLLRGGRVHQQKHQ
uniref:Uncharacterized protein n=1 Tax=viral metagenome TaxID=1070528 RepID=A0A6C0CEG8_9ZZZZ